MSFGLGFLKNVVHLKEGIFLIPSKKEIAGFTSRWDASCYTFLSVSPNCMYRALQSWVQRRISKGQRPSLNLTWQLLRMVPLAFSPSFGALSCQGVHEAFYSGWYSLHSSEIQISVSVELFLSNCLAQCFLNLICIWITWGSFKMQISDASRCSVGSYLDAMVSLQVY